MTMTAITAATDALEPHSASSGPARRLRILLAEDTRQSAARQVFDA